MDIDKFIQIIKHIIADKMQTIQYGYESRGGLEKWFQVEIYAAYKALDKNYPIEREVEIDVPHPTKKLCDFQIDDTFVELKVETAEYSGDAFLDAYLDDVTLMEDVDGHAILITKHTYSLNLPEERKIGDFYIIVDYQ